MHRRLHVSALSALFVSSLTLLSFFWSPVSGTLPDGKTDKDSLIGEHRYYLEMHATVRKALADPKLKGILLDSALFSIYTDSNRLVAEHYSLKKGECRFRLPLNRKLVMIIRKKGYVSKIIELNSIVPPERKTVYVFLFDIDLFENAPGLDTRVLQKPVARVTFNKDKNNFEYDADYTNKVNSSLKELYKNYAEKLKAEKAAPK